MLKPIDFDKSKKYPAILEIHGGPKAVYGDTFFHEMQVMVSKGYFVFYCNPRGSAGMGDVYADLRLKWGTIDYDDIMKFVDTVLENYPQIDSEKVGVAGGSYGGYMTNWLIGHTDRFKCAVSQRGISNWITMFGLSDVGSFMVEEDISINFLQDIETTWWHSPMRYAADVKTPTLFIHSENDFRCPLSEAMQMYSALKHYNVATKMCIFKDENHELSRSGKPKHRIRRLEEILAWMDSYLIN